MRLRVFVLGGVAVVTTAIVAAVIAAGPSFDAERLGLALAASVAVGLSFAGVAAMLAGRSHQVMRDVLNALPDVPREAGSLPQPLADSVARTAERLRRAELAAAQHERLFGAVLDAAAVAIVLYGDSGHIALTNPAARELFFEGRAPADANFLRLLKDAPPALRAALIADSDGLFSIESPTGPETYHVSRRTFDIGDEPHTLLMVKRLTREMSRQESEVWRKVIRVIAHELNNSLAPISSLVHSARLIVGQPDSGARLERVFGVIEERSRHLQMFLEGYARLARLPKPRPAEVRWDGFVERLQALYPALRVGPLPSAPGWFDPGQMEQVAINLVKNAVEASGPEREVRLDVDESPDGVALRVHDEGRGFSAEGIANALLPFYTTKEGGSGLGLALVRDIVEAHGGRVTIENREGAGATVTCWLPARGGGDVSSRARLTLSRA